MECLTPLEVSGAKNKRRRCACQHVENSGKGGAYRTGRARSEAYPM